MEIGWFGNSNSILIKPLLSEIRKQDVIHQFSIGASPSPFHIYQALTNLNTVSNCDVVVIEPVVIDRITYESEFNLLADYVNNYFLLIKKYCQNIILLILPARPDHVMQDDEVRDIWANSAKMNGSYIIDFYLIMRYWASCHGEDILPKLWIDKSHHVDYVHNLSAGLISMLIDYHLYNDNLATVDSDAEERYLAYTGNELSTINNLEFTLRQNSFLKAECIALSTDWLYIKCPLGINLIGMLINWGGSTADNGAVFEFDINGIKYKRFFKFINNLNKPLQLCFHNIDFSNSGTLAPNIKIRLANENKTTYLNGIELCGVLYERNVSKKNNHSELLLKSQDIDTIPSWITTYIFGTKLMLKHAIDVANPTADTLLAIGIAASNALDWYKAVRYLSAALSLRPSGYYIRLRYALALANTGNRAQSEEQLSLLEGTPDYPGRNDIINLVLARNT